jgi:hypothetical protein
MQKASATALPGCVVAATLLASGGAAASWQSGDTRLPRTSVVVHAPSGWVCSADSNSSFEGQTTALLSCLPKQGGISFDVQKLIGNERPASLDAYMRELSSRPAARPRSFASLPRRFDIGGRPAVESASRGQAIMDSFDEHGATVEMISEVTVIEDHGQFYRCSFSTTPMQYTDAVRRAYQNFCGSITFDGP